MKKIRGRLFLVLFLSVVSFYLFLPSWPGLYDRVPESLRWLVPPRGVSLGLDLQGGIHLVLEVEEDRAVEIAVDRAAKAMQDLLTDKDVAFDKIERVGSLQVQLDVSKDGTIKETAELIRDEFPAYFQVSRESRTLVVELLDSEVDRIKKRRD